MEWIAATQGPAKEPPKDVHKDWLAATKRCVLFEHLSHSETKYVEETARLMPTEPGKALYEVGDLPSSMYIVLSGRYRASVDKAADDTSFSSEYISRQTYTGLRRARDYGPLDNFGAAEMLRPDGDNHLRVCTVTVIEGGFVWVLPQRVVTSKLKIPPLANKSQKDVLELCGQVRLFRGISKERLMQLARACHFVVFGAHETIFEAGANADEIFVVRSGTVVTPLGQTEGTLTLTQPEAFGESALFPDDEDHDTNSRVRMTSMTAGRDGAELMRIKVSAIETLIGYELQQAAIPLVHRRLLTTAQVSKRTFVEGLRLDEVEHVLSVMEEHTWAPKEVVAPAGAFEEGLFLIKRGTAIVKKGEKHEVARLERGECFGEQALLPPEMMKPHRRRVSVVAASGDAHLVTLSLTADGLNSLLEGGGDAAFTGMRRRVSLQVDGTNEQGIDVWARKLKVDVLNNAVAGVDCAVVTKIEASGGDIEELLPPSPSKSGKKKDPRDSKNGGRNSKADEKKKSLEERKSASAALRESRRSSTILGNMVRRMSRSSVPAQEADGEGEEEVPDWIAEEREQDRAKARASVARRRSSFLDQLGGLFGGGGEKKEEPQQGQRVSFAQKVRRASRSFLG